VLADSINAAHCNDRDFGTSRTGSYRIKLHQLPGRAAPRDQPEMEGSHPRCIDQVPDVDLVHFFLRWNGGGVNLSPDALLLFTLTQRITSL
jgi:hypothetical protein